MTTSELVGLVASGASLDEIEKHLPPLSANEAAAINRLLDDLYDEGGNLRVPKKAP